MVAPRSLSFDNGAQCESALRTVDSLSGEISKLEALYATCQVSK